MMDAFAKALAESNTYNIRYRCVNARSKQVMWVDSFSDIIRDDQGNPQKILGLKQDITAKVCQEQLTLELQEHKIHLARLASMGQLSASIAHEINNPLAIMQSALRHMSRHLVKKNILAQDLTESLSRCTVAIERIITTTKGIRNFSRADSITKETLDLNEIIRDFMLSIGQLYQQEDVDISLDLHASPLLIDGDSCRLQQVIANLISNAKDATEAQDSRQISIRTGVDDDHVLLEVIDNGPGIDEKLLPKLFDRFFTTKSVGKGTGIGLSIVKQIIEGNGGKIVVKSRPGEGTTFQVKLPASLRHNTSG